MVKQLLVFLLFVLAGCQSRQNLSMMGCDRFLGNWKMESSGRMILEEWKRLSDTLYEGKSYSLANNDTVLLETVELKIRNKSLVYSPTVTGQNDGKEILFPLNPDRSDLTAGRFVFENLKHDFPQRIIYHWKSEDVLDARVEGEFEGKMEFEDYAFRRVGKNKH